MAAAALAEGAGVGDGLIDSLGDGVGDADGDVEVLGLAVGVTSTEGVGVASLGEVSAPTIEDTKGPTAEATGPLARVMMPASTTTRSTRSHGDPFDGRGSATVEMIEASPIG